MTYTVVDVRQEGGMYRAKVDLGNGASASFPFSSSPSPEDIEKSVADYLHVQELLATYCEDRVYSGGVLARVDTHRRHQPSTGRSEGSRAPYNASHNSAYYIGVPSASLLSEFQVADRNGLAGWFGVKTADSGERFLKVVRETASWPNKPELVGSVWVYASVFSEDGTESDVKDVYLNASPEEMQQWCVDNNVAYPIPNEETQRPWCFGIYWNSVTGAVEGVKGYVRYT